MKALNVTYVPYMYPMSLSDDTRFDEVVLVFRVCIKQRHRLSTRPSFTETKNQFDRALGPRSVPVPPAFLLAKLVLRLPHANPVPVAATALARGVAGLPTETAAILPGIEPALVPIVEPAPIPSVTVVPPAAPTAAAASIAPTAHTAAPAAPPASSHRRASPPLLLARPEPLVRAAAFTAAERIPARAVRTVTVPTPVASSLRRLHLGPSRRGRCRTLL